MTQASAGQDERLRRPAEIRSLQVGQALVTYVPDGAVQLTPRGWFPETTDEDWAAHPEYLDDSGNLVGSIGGLLVELDGHTLLIDAGFGPQSLPAGPGNPQGAIHGGALLKNLATIGRTPEEIAAVAFTHLHIDHVGWAWHADPANGRPAFSNAEYVVAEPEWRQRHLLEAHGTSRQILAALEPRVRTAADGEEVIPGVQVMLTPGHTAGHAAYIITSGGQRLIAFGDALHSPIQLDHPEWSAASDHDRDQAGEFRHRLVDELKKPDTIGFGVHFADVVFGRVHQGGRGPAWQPVSG